MAKAFAEAQQAAAEHDPEHYKTKTARRLIETDRKFRQLRDRRLALTRGKP